MALTKDDLQALSTMMDVKSSGHSVNISEA